MSRCRAEIIPKNRVHRSRFNCEGPRCCRKARFNGLCHQHATAHDRHIQRMIDRDTINGKPFHAATDHDWIVQRILDIPCRD